MALAPWVQRALARLPWGWADRSLVRAAQAATRLLGDRHQQDTRLARTG
ncbi:hypothetical protein K1W54_26040 [Micromonospora sp. CPCC 205371]|nr:hypothetical protein [Micromonospora sp. CPCC 205371]